MYFVKQMCIDYANFGGCNVFFGQRIVSFFGDKLFFS